MSILVTGGAGYIGSHVVRSLLEEGHRVIVLDDLSTGQQNFVPPEAHFVHGNVLNTAALEHLLLTKKVTGVIHLAGYKYAGMSVNKPLFTYQQNVQGTGSLLAAMDYASVNKLVFSSSAAVYGTPVWESVTESSPTNPESPYGESKLAAEWLIRSQDQAKIGLKHTSLRYFNVAGSGDKSVYDASPYNLFPRIISALRAGEKPVLYGGNYPTPDGTAIRDYVHVSDLADIHVQALMYLDDFVTSPIFNIGSGGGSSVLEVMQAFKDVTGIDFKLDVHIRRTGDPVRIVADCERAADELGWEPTHTLEDMVRSAWEANPKQPRPYRVSRPL